MHTDTKQAAFVAVVADELPRLQRVARLLTGNAHAADDLVAEAIARTFPRWRSGGLVDPAAYLRRAIVNASTSRWRRRGLAMARDRAALDWLPVARDAADEHAERDRVMQALGGLPPRRRAIVVLRFYDDLTEAAIAELMHIKLGTVKSQLSRALGQLREALERLDPV